MRPTKTTDKKKAQPARTDMADANEIGRDRGAGMLGEGRRVEFADGCNAADSYCLRELHPEMGQPDEWGWTGDGSWWATEPDVGRVANGVAARVDRLKAIGNGQVPSVAASAFRILTERAGWSG